MQYYRKQDYQKERQRIMLKHLRHLRAIKIPIPVRERIDSELDKLKKNSCISVN